MPRTPALAAAITCLIAVPAAAAATTTTDPTNGGRGNVATEKRLTRTTVPGLQARWSATPSSRAPGAALIGGEAVFVPGTTSGPGIEALDPSTGAPAWTWHARSDDAAVPVRSLPTRIIAVQDGEVTGLDRATGKELWSRPGLPGSGTTAVASFNRIFPASDKGFGVIDAPDGRLRWWMPSGTRVHVAVADGWIFATGDDGLVSSRRPKDGAARWKQEVGTGDCGLSTAFMSKGTGFFMAPDGKGALRLIALDARSGKPRWVNPVGRDRCRSGETLPRTVADANRVYAALPDGRVAAVDRHTGKDLWTIDTGVGTVGDPVVTSGGVVFVVTTDGVLLAINTRDGEPLWKQDLGSAPLGGPAAGNGSVVVRTRDGRVSTFSLDVGRVDTGVSTESARRAVERMGVTLDEERFSLEDLRVGMGVELAQRTWEDGDDDEYHAAKLAYEHLRGTPDYYRYLSASDVTTEQAARAMERLGLKPGERGLSLDRIRVGMGVELAHRTWGEGLSQEDRLTRAAKLAYVHLADMPDYYASLSGAGVTAEQVRALGETFGITWRRTRFTPAQFQLGINTELRDAWKEQGGRVREDDIVAAAKRAYERLSTSSRSYAGEDLADVTVIREDESGRDD